MGSVVNLNKRRKLKARQTAEQLATENRVRFGRSKAQKQLDVVESDLARQHLDRLRREPD